MITMAANAEAAPDETRQGLPPSGSYLEVGECWLALESEPTAVSPPPRRPVLYASHYFSLPAASSGRRYRCSSASLGTPSMCKITIFLCILQSRSSCGSKFFVGALQETLNLRPIYLLRSELLHAALTSEIRLLCQTLSRKASFRFLRDSSSLRVRTV